MAEEDERINEYEEAKYEVEMARNNKEWEAAMNNLDQVSERYNSFMAKKETVQAAFDHLSEDVPNLKASYDQAKGDRESEAAHILENGGIDVGVYDPSEGPPSMPEDESATTGSGTGSGSASDTGSGSGTGSGSSDTGSTTGSST